MGPATFDDTDRAPTREYSRDIVLSGRLPTLYCNDEPGHKEIYHLRSITESRSTSELPRGGRGRSITTFFRTVRLTTSLAVLAPTKRTVYASCTLYICWQFIPSFSFSSIIFLFFFSPKAALPATYLLGCFDQHGNEPTLIVLFFQLFVGSLVLYLFLSSIFNAGLHPVLHSNYNQHLLFIFTSYFCFLFLKYYYIWYMIQLLVSFGSSSERSGLPSINFKLGAVAHTDVHRARRQFRFALDIFVHGSGDWDSIICINYDTNSFQSFNSFLWSVLQAREGFGLFGLPVWRGITINFTGYWRTALCFGRSACLERTPGRIVMNILSMVSAFSSFSDRTALFKLLGKEYILLLVSSFIWDSAFFLFDSSSKLFYIFHSFCTVVNLNWLWLVLHYLHWTFNLNIDIVVRCVQWLLAVLQMVTFSSRLPPGQVRRRFLGVHFTFTFLLPPPSTTSFSVLVRNAAFFLFPSDLLLFSLGIFSFFTRNSTDLQTTGKGSIVTFYLYFVNLQMGSAGIAQRQIWAGWIYHNSTSLRWIFLSCRREHLPICAAAQRFLLWGFVLLLRHEHRARCLLPAAASGVMTSSFWHPFSLLLYHS